MREVDANVLAGLAMRPTSVFDEPAFATLNAAHADRVVYLVLGEPEVRFGLIAGVRDGWLLAPFSAPWSLPLLGKARPRVQDFEHAAKDLASAVDALDVAGVELVLPAGHVAPDVVAKWSWALAAAGFRPLVPELSFHVNLAKYEIAPKAHQKLRAARRCRTRFYCASDGAGLAAAYGVIKANRESRGYPLRMSLDQVAAMRAVVPIDCLVLEAPEGPIAAAICYRLSMDIAYLVYWGDVREATVPHAMNLLAHELCTYYLAQGCRILDTGAASIEGAAQRGLADFKQSIGGTASLRARYTIP